MPSRISNGRLLDNDESGGTVIPNTFQIMVSVDGVLNDRVQGTRYVIHARSSESKPWSRLGVISSGKPVPEVGKVFSAKLYTTKLTKSTEPLRKLQGSERFRTSGGIFTWIDN